MRSFGNQNQNGRGWLRYTTSTSEFGVIRLLTINTDLIYVVGSPKLVFLYLQEGSWPVLLPITIPHQVS
jgi:hypothetical protein